MEGRGDGDPSKATHSLKSSSDPDLTPSSAAQWQAREPGEELCRWGWVEKWALGCRSKTQQREQPHPTPPGVEICPFSWENHLWAKIAKKEAKAKKKKEFLFWHRGDFPGKIAVLAHRLRG